MPGNVEKGLFNTNAHPSTSPRTTPLLAGKMTENGNKESRPRRMGPSYAFQIVLVVVMALSEFSRHTWSTEDFKTKDLTKTSPPSHHPETLASDLRHTNLVFMGDSITRYQYLSLVYYLRWGTWFDPSKRSPHLVEEGTYVSPIHSNRWLEFFWQSNRFLDGWETCDCYRPPTGKAKRQLPRVCENRYFYDPDRNVTVTYLQAYGNSPLHGHWDAASAYETIGRKEGIPMELTNYTWEYQTWSDAIRQYVANLQPRPDYVIMNTAYWGNGFLRNDTTRLSLQKAFQDTGISPIWKTSTSGKNGYIQSGHQEVDELMCPLFGNCLNLTWTRDIDHRRLMWDFAHFLEPVYRQMNEQLLGMIVKQ